jgi:DNA polymerase-3 subunit gamma/tau
MADQADRLGAGTLTRFAEIVHTGLTEMRGATAPRLLLELLCARMLLPAADPAEGGGAYLHRLERLERRLTIAPEPAAEDHPVGRDLRGAAAPEEPDSAPPPARCPAPAQESTPAPDPAEVTPADPAPVGALDAAAVRRVWQALLDVVREQSRATQVLLTNATATAVEGDVLVLTLPTAPLARRLAEDRNVDMIRGALRNVLGVDWQIRCEHAGGDSGPRVDGARPPQRPPDPSPERRGPGRRPATPAPPTRPAPRRAAPPAGDDEIPPPPEPAEPEPPGDPDPGTGAAPQDDDEAMLAEAAAADRDGTARRDPEDVALQLLAEQLGARRIDER